jgi:hypothetical protein
LLPLHWVTRSFSPKRYLAPVVDFVGFKKLVSSAIASKNALEYSSYEICKWGMMKLSLVSFSFHFFFLVVLRIDSHYFAFFLSLAILSDQLDDFSTFLNTLSCDCDANITDDTSCFVNQNPSLKRFKACSFLTSSVFVCCLSFPFLSFHFLFSNPILSIAFMFFISYSRRFHSLDQRRQHYVLQRLCESYGLLLGH